MLCGYEGFDILTSSHTCGINLGMLVDFVESALRICNLDPQHHDAIVGRLLNVMSTSEALST